MLQNLIKRFPLSYFTSHLTPAFCFIFLTICILGFTDKKGNPIISAFAFFEGIKLNLSVFILMIFFSSIFLYSMNMPIIKLYEGLLGRKWFPLWKYLEKRRRDEFNNLMQTLKDKSYNSDKERYQIEKKIMDNFPSTENDILPTRLGNVIAAFEHYPYRRYNIDAITIWPRLISVIPDSYKTYIDDSKAHFCFLINMSLVSLIIGFECIIFAFLYYFYHLLYFSFLSILLSYIFYRFSFIAARSWGEIVKSSFDLYRYSLLNNLGIYLPDEAVNSDFEANLWEELQWSMRFMYKPGNTIKYNLRTGSKLNEKKENK